MQNHFSTQHKGQQAEKQALQYLERCGLKIIQQNYCCRGGEIDIIAQDKRIIVFVEVRSRSRSHYGNAAESITVFKQKRIILAARHYLMKFATLPVCRFDALLFDNGLITWQKDCFQLK